MDYLEIIVCQYALDKTIYRELRFPSEILQYWQGDSDSIHGIAPDYNTIH